jgi:hypothetical protein
MRVGRKPNGLIVVVDERRERQEAAQKAADEAHFGPIELRHEDDRERLGKMMHDILHMSEFRGGVLCLGPMPSHTKDKYKARRRLWRHFADELLGVDWECEEYC